MTQLEALAYCRNLAREAWPDVPVSQDTTGGILTDYSAMMQHRASRKCMSQHGYPGEA